MTRFALDLFVLAGKREVCPVVIERRSRSLDSQGTKNDPDQRPD
jgi:hypothetical protein